MRQYSLIFLMTLIFSFSIRAQEDSVQYQVGMQIPDGVYLSFWDFRHNQVIGKEQIVSDMNPELLDYVGKALEKEKLVYKIKGNSVNIASKEVWGYVQNGTFYVNYQGKFYRIPVFGAISYFIAVVEVKQSGYYDPRFGTYSGSVVTQEQREFYMNFHEGVLRELKTEEVEIFLGRDKTLYEEYQALNKRKQKEQLDRVIRRYNENHPVYFLKGSISVSDPCYSG